MISDLYIQEIKAFKPKALSQEEITSAVKAFQFPAKPAVPQAEISAEAVDQYEAAEVETEVPTGEHGEAVEEDWFVFEEETDAHH